MDGKDVLVMLAIAGLIALLIFAVVYVIDKTACNAKTANIGFSHHYGLLSGCMIEVKPGQWIPLDSYYFKQE